MSAVYIYVLDNSKLLKPALQIFLLRAALSWAVQCNKFAIISYLLSPISMISLSLDKITFENYTVTKTNLSLRTP